LFLVKKLSANDTEARAVDKLLLRLKRGTRGAGAGGFLRFMLRKSLYAHWPLWFNRPQESRNQEWLFELPVSWHFSGSVCN
jgi:hypothetical protein